MRRNFAKKNMPLQRKSKRAWTLEPLEQRLVLDSTVVFNEIMYNPTGTDESLEWVELHNQMAVDMDISGWQLSDGVDYEFPPGTVLEGGGYLIVAANPTALQTATGFSTTFGPYTGALSNGGERIELVNNSGSQMDELNYGDNEPWPVAPDGSGATLAKANPNTASDIAENWTTSAQVGGTPGAVNFVTGLETSTEIDLFGLTDQWSYDDSGVDPGAGWQAPVFAEPGWQDGDGIFQNGIVSGPADPGIGDGLKGYWPLEELSGTTVPNTIVGGTTGTIFNGVSWVNDAQRGQVLQFDGANGYVTAGTISSLAPTDDFTWSLWSNAVNGPNNNVMLGNRFPNSGWIKFTNSAFEYRDVAPDTFNNTIPSAENSTNTWIHRAVVKSGDQLTYYRNGVVVGTSTVTATMPTINFFFGGDTTNENWAGKLDDIAIWENALPVESIIGLSDGTYTPATAPTVGTSGGSQGSTQISSFDEDFTADTIIPVTWNEIEYGLESKGGGTATNFTADTTTNVDQLTLSGTANVNYWGGQSIRSIDSFDPDLETVVTVDRVSLSGSGSAYRSSVWLWANDGNYLHFSHNVGENGWSYNVNNTAGIGTSNPTGGGNDLGAFNSLDGDLGNHEMKLVYKPTGNNTATIEMYIDDVLGASHSVSNWTDFHVMLTGQARMTGDTVTAVFDNLNITSSVSLNFNTELGEAAVDTPHSAYYFRKEFTFSDDPALTTLELTSFIDDGAVIYLNGNEVYRQNMPAGTITHTTAALSEVDGFPISGPIIIPTTHLIQGNNVLAVEIHSATGTDDVFFGASLSATVDPPTLDVLTPLFFNEVASATDAPFWVEIVNPNDSSLDIGGYVIASSNEAFTPYVISTQTLNSGELLQITEAELGFDALSGDRLFLYSPGQAAALDAVVVKNRLLGRSAEYGMRWLSPDIATPGTANSFDFETDIVINEIQYHARGIPGSNGTPATFDTTSLIAFDATWRHSKAATTTALDLPYDAGTDWDNTAHVVDNLDWFSAQAPLGYETDALPIGTPPLNNFADPLSNINTIKTYYFEHDFSLTQPDIDSFTDLSLKHMIDDGAVFYLNGTILDASFNMPAGTPDVNTSASSGIGEATISSSISIPANLLVAGLNRLSVEVHQRDDNGGADPSSDIVFAVELEAREILDPGTPAIPFTESDEQWIELYNHGAAPVDLTGWEFSDGISYEFADNTMINPGEYLVVAKDAADLLLKHPGINVVGDFSGKLSRSGERIELSDAAGNPADVVTYFDDGRWDGRADGGGSSLELRDADADNALPEAWTASDETASGIWQTITYQGFATSPVGPTNYNELILGLLDAGEVLIDDISVIEDPGGANRQLIQNGSFTADSIGGSAVTWRIIGNHGTSEIVLDPDDPGNQVLRLVASGPTEHMHNHAETTLKDGSTFITINAGLEYEISFRARAVSGSNQLNSRLYFNRLARTTILDVPTTSGTPGAANSTAQTNIGPTYSDFNHGPVVPAAAEDVTVTVQAEDPDGILVINLKYSVDGAGVQNVTMTNQGNGIYTGTIPGQAAATVVQFWVEGIDSDGAMSTFPAEGAASRALFKVQDNKASSIDVHNFRIIMTTADADLLHQDTNVMSNARIGATVIYNESEVFYDVGVKLKGSERGRPKDVRVSFNVGFDPMQLFRGVHKSIAIDRSGAGDQFSQKEILVKHAINSAGDIPTQYDDLIHVIAPRDIHTGSAMLQMARYTDTFLDETFDNGSDGQLFKYELIYFPTTTVGGGPEGLKLPSPDSVIGVGINDNLGADKESYRWNFLIRNKRTEDDYSTLLPVLDALGMSAGTQFHEKTAELLDVDQWLRSFAIQTLWGIGDNYISGAQHNAQFYTRPEDGKTLFLPWDMDFTGSVSATAGLSLNGELNKLLTLTNNDHYYLGHLQDIITTTFNNAYMDPWIDHFSSKLPAENLSSFSGYISSRSTHINSLLPGQVAYNVPAITMDVGPSATADIIGTGWVNVREIRLAGSSDPLDVTLDVTWTTTTAWQATIPVNFGTEDYMLKAYDFQGNLIGTQTINITSSLSTRPLEDFLRVTELNYNPDGSDGPEFIELKNISSGLSAVTLDLAGVQITEGPSSPFEFTGSNVTSLLPGEFVLIVKDQTAFNSVYGNSHDSIIAGQFAGSLNNSGEEIKIVDGNGAIIQQFIYEDGNGVGEEQWHPETDGEGFTLIVKDPSSNDDLNLGTSWRSSSEKLGSPGEDDPDALSADFNGDKTVDTADLAILLENYGKTTGADRSIGDANHDRKVSLQDLLLLKQQFGDSVSAPPPAAAAAALTVIIDNSTITSTVNKEAIVDRAMVSVMDEAITETQTEEQEDALPIKKAKSQRYVESVDQVHETTLSPTSRRTSTNPLRRTHRGHRTQTGVLNDQI